MEVMQRCGDLAAAMTVRRSGKIVVEGVKQGVLSQIVIDGIPGVCWETTMLR
jgi:hypothetical protein